MGKHISGNYYKTNTFKTITPFLYIKLNYCPPKKPESSKTLKKNQGISLQDMENAYL